MKAIMDLHTHTLAAGHAYSTLLENIDAALAMGLQYLGMSEHGPTSPGGPHNFSSLVFHTIYTNSTNILKTNELRTIHRYIFHTSWENSFIFISTS